LHFGKTEIFLQTGLDSEMTEPMTDLPVGSKTAVTFSIGFDDRYRRTLA